MLMNQYSMRYFSAMPKHAKMQLTVRTPYKTLFKNFDGFKHMIVGTVKGELTITNKTFPR